MILLHYLGSFDNVPWECGPLLYLFPERCGVYRNNKHSQVLDVNISALLCEHCVFSLCPAYNITER